ERDHEHVVVQQQPGVILPPDEARHLQHIEVEEAKNEREYDRNDREREEDEHIGRHQQVIMFVAAQLAHDEREPGRALRLCEARRWLAGYWRLHRLSPPD